MRLSDFDTDEREPELFLLKGEREPKHYKQPSPTRLTGPSKGGQALAAPAGSGFGESTDWSELKWQIHP